MAPAARRRGQAERGDGRRVDFFGDLALLDGEPRSADAIAREAGQPGPAPLVVPARLTQTDLAGLIGSTRESVNKWLRVYQRRGLIRHERGQLTIVRPDELRRSID